jgi:hypothetical protein
MRKYFLIAGFSVCVSMCSGQSPWKFRSDNYAGLETGQLGGRGHVETVNGLYKGPWFLGLGAGLDYYRFRSVPLFLSVSRDLLAFGNRSGLSLYLDGGINLPWYKRDLTTYQTQLVSSSKFYARPWGSGGLGYKWRLSARTDKALLVSAGYSIKKLEEKLTGTTFCATSSCPLETPNQTYIYDYVNHTFLFLVGFRF